MPEKGICKQVDVPAATPEQPGPALSRDDILGASDLELQPVYVPEWQGWVYLRPMTGAERDKLEKITTGRGGVDEVIARILCWVICDEAGNPRFDESDAKALNAKSLPALVRLFKVAQKQNALTDDDIEELAKN